MCLISRTQRFRLLTVRTMIHFLVVQVSKGDSKSLCGVLISSIIVITLWVISRVSHGVILISIAKCCGCELIIPINDGSITVVEIAFKVCHICLKALFGQVGDHQWLLSYREPLVLNYPLATISKNLNPSDESLGYVEVATGSETRLWAWQPNLSSHWVERLDL